MVLRSFLNDETSCASYLFGCTSHGQLAVVDPHADLVGAYLAAARVIGSPIVAVFETHVQADHVSGLTGDSLLIGDVGRPDLHVIGDPAGQAGLLHGSLRRLAEELLREMPDRPTNQAAIVAANRRGEVLASV